MDMKHIFQKGKRTLRSGVAMIATVALLFTLLSSYATISFFALTTTGTKLLADFEGNNKITVETENGGVVNGELKHTTDGGKAAKTVFHLKGNAGDFNGSKITFDYRVEEKYNGSTLIGITCTQLSVVAGGKTYSLGPGSSNANFYFLANTEAKLSGTHTINLAGLKNVTGWTDLDTSKITEIKLIGNKTGTSGTEIQPVMYVDNITLHDAVNTADPVRPGRLMYDFSTAEQAAKILPSNDQTRITYNETAGTVSYVPTANEYGGFTVTGDVGDFGGSGIAFDYTASQKINFYRLIFHYLDETGAETSKMYEWTNSGESWSTVAVGTKTINYPSAMRAISDRITKINIHAYKQTANVTTFTLDNVRIMDPLPRVSLVAKADVVSTNVSLAWQSKDAVDAITVYGSKTPIDEAAFEAGTVTGLTVLSTEANGQKTITDLVAGEKYYVALKAVAGTETVYKYGFAQASNVKLIHNFEDVKLVTAVSSAKGPDVNGALSHNLGVAQYTTALQIDCLPGMLYGSGLAFQYTATLNGANAKAYQGVVTYVNDAGETVVEVQNDYQGGFVNFNLQEGTHTATITFPSHIDASTITQLKIWVNTTNVTSTASLQIDNICVVNPLECAQLKVEPDQNGVTATWSAADDSTVKVYKADHAISKGMLSDLAANGITEISSATDGTHTVSGLGNAVYFALTETEANGAERFVAPSGVSLIQNFETVETLSDYAYDSANKCKDVTVTEHGGSKMVKWQGKAELATEYPHITLRAPKGSFVGKAIRSYVESTTLTGDPRNEGFDQLRLLYEDLAGEKKALVIREYSAMPSGTYYEIPLTSLTDEQLLGLYAVDWYAKSGEKIVYLDNVYVVDPYELKEIRLSLSVKEQDSHANTQTAVISTVVSEGLSSPKVYVSSAAITAAQIEEFEGGAQNGLAVVNGTTLTNCEVGKTYYFALRALDSKGKPLYAYATFTAKQPSMLIQDFESVTDLASVAEGNGNLGKNAVSIVERGGSKMVEYYHNSGIGYPHCRFFVEPGSANGDKLCFDYAFEKVDADASTTIHKFYAMYRDANGNEKTVTLREYFAQASGTTMEISLAALTAEQRAGLYGFGWHYNENTLKKKIYVDNVSVVNYSDGLHSFTQQQNEKTGDVTLAWQLSHQSNADADYTVHVFTATEAFDAAAVEAHVAGTDTTRLTQVTTGSGLLTATATNLPRYTTNFFAVRAVNKQGNISYMFSQMTELKYTVVQDFESVEKLNQAAAGNAMTVALKEDNGNHYAEFSWPGEYSWCSMYLKFKPGDLCGDAIRFYYENTQKVGITDVKFTYYDVNGNEQVKVGQQYFTPTSGAYVNITFPQGMTPAERATITQIQFVFSATVGNTEPFVCKVDDVGVLNYYDSVSNITATFDENENDGTAHLSWSFTQRQNTIDSFDVRVFASKEPITEADLQAYIADPAASALVPIASGHGLTAATYKADGENRYAVHTYAVVAFDSTGIAGYTLVKTAEVPFRPLYLFEESTDILSYQAYTSPRTGRVGIYVNADAAYGVVNSIVTANEVEAANKPYVRGQAMKMHFTKEWAESITGDRWPGLTYFAPNYGDFAGEGISFTISKTPNTDGEDISFNCQFSLVLEDGSMYSYNTYSSQQIDPATVGKEFNIPYENFWLYENGEKVEQLTKEKSAEIVRTWFVIGAPQKYGEFTVYIDSVKVLHPYTVNRPLEQVQFAAEKVVVRPEGMYAPQYALVPQNTTMAHLTWSSSNTAVATVDEFGNVLAVGKGSAYIKATGQNGVSGQFKITVKETVSGVFRVLEDFDDGNMPTKFTWSGYSGLESEYVKVHERNSIRFVGAKGGTVTYTADDYAFYGEGLGVWLYGAKGGNATVTFTTKDGKKFSVKHHVDNDEGDFAVIPYASLKKNGTGAAPTEQDIIQFKTVSFIYHGELYLDSLQVSQPKNYNVYRAPQNEDNGTGIKVEQSVLDANDAVYHADKVLEGVDYDWAAGLLKDNGYYTGPDELKLFSIYYLDSHYREKEFSKEATISIPFPDVFYGQDNVWVIRLDDDGSMVGLVAEHDRETITVKSARGGIFALWLRYDTEGLYYKSKGQVVITPNDNNDDDSLVITDPDIYVPGTENQQPVDTEVLPEGAIAQGVCGDNLKWTLFSDGELVIGGSGAMYDFNDYSPWADYLDQIKYVTLLEGVTSVGACAFYGCTELLDVLLPATLTSIGDYAFFQCDKLLYLTVPASVTHIGAYAIGYTINQNSEFAIVPNFVLYGQAGSAAEEYAETYRLVFNSADQAPQYRSVRLPWWAWIVISASGVISLGEGALIVFAVIKRKKNQENAEKEEADNA